MFTADQLVAHAVGDYVLQSHWMANHKTRDSVAAALHAVFYTAPFAFLTGSWLALAAICGAHFLVDRFRLARYVVRLKNAYLAPRGTPETRDLSSATGYPADAPPWLAVWLLIIADNVLHVLINGAAIRWL